MPKLVPKDPKGTLKDNNFIFMRHVKTLVFMTCALKMKLVLLAHFLGTILGRPVCHIHTQADTNKQKRCERKSQKD